MAVPSPSRSEAALADLVEDALRACPWLDLERVGDNVVGRTTLGHAQRLVLAGHLDTVPAAGNLAPRLEGDTVWGVGASDMKGGLAVMLDLATTVRLPSVDLTWCFYAREEISRGVVPPWCVAIRASRRREYPGGEFFIPCVLVIKRLGEGERHDKAQLNQVLRDHGAST